MRSLLIVLAGACASLGTSLVVWIGLANSNPLYYEVLDDGLVQTTASEHQVNLAVAAVMEADRAPAETAVQQLTNAAYHETGMAWFAQPDAFSASAERASLLEREQVGRDGLKTDIDVLCVAEMPTLVFIHHDDPAKRNELAESIGNALARRGINRR